jgi:hypothetical protein
MLGKKNYESQTEDDHIRFIAGKENDKYRKGMRDLLNFDLSVAMFDERVQWENNFFKTFRKVYFQGVWRNNGVHPDGHFAALHERR